MTGIAPWMDFVAGDIVDICIKNARVTKVSNGGGVFTAYNFDIGAEIQTSLVPGPTTQITKVAPKPQAGDVWELRSGLRAFVVDDGESPSLVFADGSTTSNNLRHLAGAELLFRLKE